MSVATQNKVERTFGIVEIKDSYRTIVEKGADTVVKRERNKRAFDHFKYEWKNNKAFYGCTSDEMLTWFKTGYKMPGLRLEPPLIPVTKRRRLIFGEEGEYQHDLALSGFDYPFLDWEQREQIPGLRVEIQTGFLAGTKAAVLTDYYNWILRSLIAIETAGVDLIVWFKAEASDALIRDNRNIVTNFQAKKEGEQMDYLGWSFFLSPGLHRHLVFMARTIAADENARDVDTGMGSSVNRGPWSVTYDPERNVLAYKCPNSPTAFPEDEMTIQLQTVLKEARGLT